MAGSTQIASFWMSDPEADGVTGEVEASDVRTIEDCRAILVDHARQWQMQQEFNASMKRMGTLFLTVAAVFGFLGSFLGNAAYG